MEDVIKREIVMESYRGHEMYIALPPVAKMATYIVDSFPTKSALIVAKYECVGTNPNTGKFLYWFVGTEVK